MLHLSCHRKDCQFDRRLTASTWQSALPIAFYSALLAIASSAIAPRAMAQNVMAQNVMAQNVIDGLPPPPTIPDLEPQPAPEPELESPPGTPSSERPQPQASPSVAQTYRVVINSDSPFLLEQVQRVDPTAAFERDQDRFVIVAGQFAQEAEAEALVEALADQGIGAEVAVAPPASVPEAPLASGDTAASGDAFAQPGSSIAADLSSLPPADLGPSASQAPVVAPALENPALENPASENLASENLAPAEPTPAAPLPSQSAPLPGPTARAPEPADSDYYIVVPGEADALARLQGQIALLGAAPGAIAQRDRPLGPHLLIGPFDSRQSATRWNTFLQDFGMDARVYYRR